MRPNIWGKLTFKNLKIDAGFRFCLLAFPSALITSSFPNVPRLNISEHNEPQSYGCIKMKPIKYRSENNRATKLRPCKTVFKNTIRCKNNFLCVFFWSMLLSFCFLQSIKIFLIADNYLCLLMSVVYVSKLLISPSCD